VLFGAVLLILPICVIFFFMRQRVTEAFAKV
jgi:hypothetical protein